MWTYYAAGRIHRAFNMLPFHEGVEFVEELILFRVQDSAEVVRIFVEEDRVGAWIKNERFLHSGGMLGFSDPHFVCSEVAGSVASNFCNSI